jgi:hypothetical protein
MYKKSLNSTGEYVMVVVSDIHLHHPRTKTNEIIEHLDEVLTNKQALMDVDLLVFAGDVFDDAMQAHDADVDLVIRWVWRTLKLCLELGVVVRVLEGTPSHDRKQSMVFETVRSLDYPGLDMKYVADLSIEHIEALNIDVLYVPDEWHHDSADTFAEVMGLMEARGLTQVDHAFMHGMFQYQVPEVSNTRFKHNEQDYMRIVKQLIFIGHVHMYSNFERIYAQGSFDRLCHGDEVAKGYLKAIVRRDDSYQCNFIENKNAKKYVTLTCFGEDLEQNLLYLANKIKKLPADSYVRILTEKTNALSRAEQALREINSFIHWGFLFKELSVKASPIITEKSTYTPIIINRNTIMQLVSERLLGAGAEKDVYESAMLRLEEVI